VGHLVASEPSDAVLRLKELIKTVDPRASGFFSVLLSKSLAASNGTQEDVQYWQQRAHNLEFAEAAWVPNAEDMLTWLRENKSAQAIADALLALRNAPQAQTGGLLMQLMQMPRPATFILSDLKILLNDYGFARSMEDDSPVDASGTPIPLYTYPTIDFLHQHDFSAKDVFEFGSGMSTLWWGQRARRVVAAENNKEWYETVRTRYVRDNPNATNVEVLYGTGAREFAALVHSAGVNYDVIIVDGASNRHNCAHEGLKRLRKGGMVILDNAEWYPQTASSLRAGGLIQVDFFGFKATESHSSATSIFFHPEFQNRPKSSRQPTLRPGNIDVGTEWDTLTVAV